MRVSGHEEELLRVIYVEGRWLGYGAIQPALRGARRLRDKRVGLVIQK